MKTKISISIERELNESINEFLVESIFRNKSHLIEHAIKNFIKGGQDDF